MQKAEPEPDHAADNPAPVSQAQPAAPAELDLAERVRGIIGLSNAEIESMGFDRLAAEIRPILDDPGFEQWPIDRQFPIVERIFAIYTWFYSPVRRMLPGVGNGRSLIAGSERILRRTQVTP